MSSIYRNIIVLACVFIAINSYISALRLNSDENSANSLFNIDGPIKLKTRGARKYCGQVLVNTMSLVCDSRYVSQNGKRSAIYYPYFYHSKKNLIEANDFAPLTEQSLDYGYDVFERKTRGGLSDECCAKPCTLSTMRLYCGD